MSKNLFTASVSSLLFLILIWQALMFMREDVASFYPKSRNLLSSLGRPMNLEVGWKSLKNGATIEIAEIKKLTQGLYILTLSIRTNAIYAIKSPGLRITLKDANNKAILQEDLSGQQWIKKDGLVQNEYFSTQLYIEVPLSSEALDYNVELLPE